MALHSFRYILSFQVYTCVQFTVILKQRLQLLVIRANIEQFDFATKHTRFSIL